MKKSKRGIKSNKEGKFPLYLILELLYNVKNDGISSPVYWNLLKSLHLVFQYSLLFLLHSEEKKSLCRFQKDILKENKQ